MASSIKRLKLNAEFFKKDIDGIELQLSIEKSEYAKNNLFGNASWNKKQNEKQPDCPECTRKYKKYYVGDKAILPNIGKCPVDSFDFKVFKKCGYKLSLYYKTMQIIPPKHLLKKIEYTQICKFYPKENEMVKTFKQILRSKDCNDHEICNIEKRSSCKYCKKKIQCRKWKIMVFVLKYYEIYCQQQKMQYMEQDEIEEDFDVECKENNNNKNGGNSPLLELSHTNSTDDEQDIDLSIKEEESKYNNIPITKPSLKNNAMSEPLITQQNSSSIVKTPSVHIWAPSDYNNNPLISPLPQLSDNNDIDEQQKALRLSQIQFSRSQSDTFMYDNNNNNNNKMDKMDKNDIDENDMDDIDDMNEEEIKQYIDDDEDEEIQNKETEIFHEWSESNTSSISNMWHLTAIYNNNNNINEYRTPHNIRLVLNGIIDILSLIDCRWYKSKIILIEPEIRMIKISKINVKKTINKHETINFWNDFWRIQLNGSRCNENYDIPYYDYNDIGIYSLNVTKYAKEHKKQYGIYSDLNKTFYSSKIDKLPETKILNKGWMMKKGRINNKKKYVLRYFVLRNNKKLYYYKTDKVSIKQYLNDPIDLNTIQELKKNDKEETYSFIMKTSYKKQRWRYWYFKCKTAQSLTDWMSVLCIFYYNKLPPLPPIQCIKYGGDNNNTTKLIPKQLSILKSNESIHPQKYKQSLPSLPTISNKKNKQQQQQRSHSLEIYAIKGISKTRSESQDLKNCLKDIPLKQGKMYKKGGGKLFNGYKLRYFALSEKDKKLYYFQDETEYYYLKYVDLRGIYKIETPNYCIFQLIEEDRRWEFKVNSEKERIEWINAIKQCISTLQLTLTRLINVLNKASDIADFFDLFINRGYTLINLLDDHIHCMRYHWNHDLLILCDKNKCKSWKRHKRDRLKDNFKDEIFCKSNFYTLNLDEIRLQDIFDNIHCFMYHRDSEILEINKENEEKQELKQKEEFDRIRFKRINRNDAIHDIDDDEENNDKYDHYQYEENLASKIDSNENEEKQKDSKTKPKYISLNLINDIDDSLAERKQNGKWDTYHHKTKYYNDALYKFAKYDCLNDGLPNEYSVGFKMNYCRRSPIHCCLKDELIALGIDDNIWFQELSKSKEILQTKEAKQQTINANNDYYHFRFGSKISIEHILALRFYCNYDSMCYSLRKSFRPDGDIESAQYVESNHYANYYWWGRFLYEAIEFYGRKMENIVYLGINERKLFQSPSAEFFQPTSTSDQFDIAKEFASSYNNNNNNKHGMILELDNQFITGSVKNETRYMYCPWISNFGREQEYLFFGYNNTILIKSIYIWTNRDYKNLNNMYWKDLKREMLAINYYAKISMGYAGIDEYNINFSKFTRNQTQIFLSKLIEFELDENKKINNIKSDTLRFIHRLFHHFLYTKTGNEFQKTCQPLLDIDFRGIKNEKIIYKLRQYLFQNAKEKNSKKWIICLEKIKKLYPNAAKYIDQDGNTQNILIKHVASSPIKKYKQRINEEEAEFVKNWLKNIVKLPQYIDNFISNGFDDIEVISKKLNNHDTLKIIGIEKLGHREKIIMYIEKLS